MFEAVLKFQLDESANTWLQGWVGFIIITPSPAETFDQSDFTVKWDVDHYECPRFDKYLCGGDIEGRTFRFMDDADERLPSP